uniref:Major facilitator superfamily (MFS) profile domain-containing protein n=1 Tax=Bionectria ochroleuca TaxID=29856 RepID=A0A0B7JKH9_BIOOC
MGSSLLVRSSAREDDRSHEYEPLTGNDEVEALESSAVFEDHEQIPFSWFEYGIFALLGMAMLNMFLAAAPYFSSRLASDPWSQTNFQSAILAVSTMTNLGVMLLLSQIQKGASYPYRINIALVINISVFALLTASTVVFVNAGPRLFLSFLLLTVAATACATGFIQNGAFAFAASFGRPEYMQALMAGQGLAGVLPALTQVVTVLAFPPTSDEAKNGNTDAATDGQSAAFFYFLAARASRKSVSLWHLFRKLHWLSLALGITFAEAMFFPVFTVKITSVVPIDNAGALFRPAAFIPLAFFFWNLGDLSGRVATIIPFPLKKRPFVLFILSLARSGFIPLYFLCNIGGRGAVISSDFFYLFIVQFCFGLTNGWMGSTCMMASGDWIEDEEREAGGGFMGLCIVIGLTMGSLLSFSVASI